MATASAFGVFRELTQAVIRPSGSDQETCDYYTADLYKTNTSTNELELYDLLMISVERDRYLVTARNRLFQPLFALTRTQPVFENLRLVEEGSTEELGTVSGSNFWRKSSPVVRVEQDVKKKDEQKSTLSCKFKTDDTLIAKMAYQQPEENDVKEMFIHFHSPFSNIGKALALSMALKIAINNCNFADNLTKIKKLDFSTLQQPTTPRANQGAGTSSAAVGLEGLANVAQFTIHALGVTANRLLTYYVVQNASYRKPIFLVECTPRGGMTVLDFDTMAEVWSANNQHDINSRSIISKCDSTMGYIKGQNTASDRDFNEWFAFKDHGVNPKYIFKQVYQVINIQKNGSQSATIAGDHIRDCLRIWISDMGIHPLGKVLILTAAVKYRSRLLNSSKELDHLKEKRCKPLLEKLIDRLIPAPLMHCPVPKTARIEDLPGLLEEELNALDTIRIRKVAHGTTGNDRTVRFYMIDGGKDKPLFYLAIKEFPRSIRAEVTHISSQTLRDPLLLCQTLDGYCTRMSICLEDDREYASIAGGFMYGKSGREMLNTLPNRVLDSANQYQQSYDIFECSPSRANVCQLSYDESEKQVLMNMKQTISAEKKALLLAFSLKVMYNFYTRKMDEQTVYPATSLEEVQATLAHQTHEQEDDA